VFLCITALNRRPQLEKALQNISGLFGTAIADSWRAPFELVGHMPGAQRKLACIASTGNKEAVADYLAEITYILIFAGLGFEIVIEPLGKKGPDLEVSRDGKRVLVEVAHFRTIHQGPPHLTSEDGSSLNDLVFTEYGNPQRDVTKAWSKILEKFGQVRDLESIIALWNDDEDMEELEVEAAVCDLVMDAMKGIQKLPKGLMFVLYGSSWVRRQQFYCFPLHVVEKPYDMWEDELQVSRASQLVAKAIAGQPNSS
jgi:hypothetical protein